MLIFSIKGFSQSLTIDETINYLNNFSLKHPGYASVNTQLGHLDDSCKTGVIYKISYGDKNVLSIQEIEKVYDCATTFKNNTRNGRLFTFDLKGFDKDNIKLKKIYNRNSNTDVNSNIVIEGEITKKEPGPPESIYTKYGTIEEEISLSVIDRDYLKVLYDGLKYLVVLANQQISMEKIEVIDDPFLKTTKGLKNRKIKAESKVTLEEENGVVSLRVMIGGKILSKFILDSGAGECNISSELEKKLIANGIIKKTDYLDNGFYKLADGSIVENRRVKIAKITIGDKTIYNVIVSIGPSGAANLLGQSFLNKIDRWAIDNSKKLLIIE